MGWLQRKHSFIHGECIFSATCGIEHDAIVGEYPDGDGVHLRSGRQEVKSARRISLAAPDQAKDVKARSVAWCCLENGVTDLFGLGELVPIRSRCARVTASRMVIRRDLDDESCMRHCKVSRPDWFRNKHIHKPGTARDVCAPAPRIHCPRRKC